VEALKPQGFKERSDPLLGETIKKKYSVRSIFLFFGIVGKGRWEKGFSPWRKYQNRGVLGAKRLLNGRKDKKSAHQVRCAFCFNQVIPSV